MNSPVSSIIYRLWDVKDRSRRMSEYARLLQTQWSRPEEISSLQAARLREAVDHAWQHCPYYRRAWGHLPRLEGRELLQLLPVVRKTDVRNAQREFLSNAFAPGELIETKTGGSTGTSLLLYFDRRCQELRNAAAMRSDGWAGWHPGMWVGGLWGTPPVPRTLKERIRNRLHDRLIFLDTMNLSPATMQDFVARMAHVRARGLFGHAHSLFVFARYLKESGTAAPAVEAIIATSMMLLESERAVIEEVFGCPVTNRYGCEEVGLIASQCAEHKGMHVNWEHVIVEILRNDGTPAAPGEEGEIVLTDLVNRGMPLIRYAIEDVASWSAQACPCGRHSPVIERLVGRVADFLVRRDGSLVAGVSLVEKTLTAIPTLTQLQIVQREPARFTLNVVPGSGYDAPSRAQLESAIREVFGTDVSIEVALMDNLPQERNSKYRFAICQVAPAARPAAIL